MPDIQRGEYPEEWPDIARKIKDSAGWRCIRCDHPHGADAGYMLTVHHLDGDKSNVQWWNLVALCQRCHLSVQARVVMPRFWMFDHSEWFIPYVAGYYAAAAGLDTDREFVEAHAAEILESVKLTGIARIAS